MKISKQERIAIICFLVAAILGVGIFVFVLPNFNKIDTNNKQLTAVKQEYSDILKHLEHTSTIDDEISKAYEEGKNLADTFYDDLTPYEADEIMRQFIATFNKQEGKNITIDGLSISPFATQTLTVSVFRSSEVTYPLKEFANTVVEQPDTDVLEEISSMNTRELVMYAKNLQATILAASEPVTVGSITVSFTVHSKKLQDLHDFVDMLFSGKYDDKLPAKATYIGSVSYQMEEKEGSTDTSDNTATDDTTSGSASTGKDEGFSMSISANLLCIKPVADPFVNQKTE